MSAPELRRRTARLAAAVWLGGAAWLVLVLTLVLPGWQEYQETAGRLAALGQELARLQEVAGKLTPAEQAVAEQRAAIRRQESLLLPPGGDVELIRQIERLAGDRVAVIAIRAGTPLPLQTAGEKGRPGSSRPDLTAGEGESRVTSASQGPAGGQEKGGTTGSRLDSAAGEESSRTTGAPQGPAGKRQSAEDGAGSGSAPYWQATYEIEAEGPWPDLLGYLRRLETEVPGPRVAAVRWRRAQGGGDRWHFQASCPVYMVRMPLSE